jgi:hypothetical protein
LHEIRIFLPSDGGDGSESRAAVEILGDAVPRVAMPVIAMVAKAADERVNDRRSSLAFCVIGIDSLVERKISGKKLF